MVFKAYFGDGAQLVPPHDQGVVAEYEKISLQEIDLAGRRCP